MNARLGVASVIAVAALGAFGVSAAAAPSFAPLDGRYKGEYVSGDHGPGTVRLRVEPLRPGLHGVRLLKWSGTLRCGDSTVKNLDVPMTAARDGRSFTGFVTYTSPPAEYSFTGSFTSTDALKAKVRVTRGTGADRCDTGPIRFVASRVGP